MKKYLLFPVLFTCFTLGCADGELDSTKISTPGQPSDKSTAPSKLPEINLTDKGLLTLAQSDLGKEYLLQASFIQQDYGQGLEGSPTSNGLQSKIVYFHQKQSSLFMMESTVGYLTSDELPSDRILAEYKITSTENGTITFDFNEGMKNILMVDDWAGSDFGPDMPRRRTLEVDHSFLKSVEKKKNRLQLEQVTQVKMGERIEPIKIIYYLEPYQPNPNYTPVESPGFKRVGFFETQPLIRPEFGDTYFNITRWDLSKPVVFHISANTPEEYREAAREGILYWNKAFGREVLKVEMGPEGITAPHPDYNMVQWVTNNGAGFAYADAQMDPRTGEIKHSQVYITSIFPVATIDRILQRLPETEPATSLLGVQNRDPLPTYALRNFQKGSLCRFPYFRENMVDSLLDLDLFTADRITAEKMGADMVRHVVAHEIGHALGLRHNFAGSISSQHHQNEIDAAFDSYLKTGESDAVLISSSSVMDYTLRHDRVLNGRFIKNGSEALPYDRLAIDWAYGGQNTEASLDETLYCTDSHLDYYNDCRVFDGAGHPLVSHSVGFRKIVDRLPNLIAELYKSAKMSRNKENQIPVAEVPLSADLYNGLVTEDLREVLSLLRKSSRSVYVERHFDMLSDINEKEVSRATDRWIDQGVAQEGGIGSLLNLIHDATLYTAIKQAPREFAAIIDSPEFREGVDWSGKPYHYTDTEIGIIKRNASLFFNLLREKLPLLVTEILISNTENPFRAIADAKGLETTLGNWAGFVITDNAEKKPTFDIETRLTATEILEAEQGLTENWQASNQEKTRNLLITKMESRFGRSIATIDPKTLPKEEAKYFAEEMSLLEALHYSTPHND